MMPGIPVGKHRGDIDGLRAIAVLSVVLHHCNFTFVPGGYTGVDIFFVISGYLITGMIVESLRSRNFSLIGFYIRRAKRILPALFVIMAATVALAMVTLTPDSRAQLGTSIVATALFSSNLLFFSETGYFDVAASMKPLLHTWSLAVEEQFYLLWPLALMLLARSPRALKIGIVSMAAASFAISCIAAVALPAAAFYLLPSRAWELLAGAVIAIRLVPDIRNIGWRTASACAGLGLIATGVFALDRMSVFPGWNALYPVIGTAMLIHSGQGEGTLIGTRILAARPVVFIGLISYSLYLWHWPLLSIADIANRHPLNTAQAVAVVALSGALAVITWKYIEQPFRRISLFSMQRWVLARYGAATLGVLAFGVILANTNGLVVFSSPAIQQAEAARDSVNPLSGSCLRWQADDGPLPGPECLSNAHGNAPVLVLWGDSHADSIGSGVREWAEKHGYSTYQLTMAACPPLLDVSIQGHQLDYTPCYDFNRKVIERLEKDQSISLVMLSARWPVYTETTRFGRDDAGPVTFLTDDYSRDWTVAGSRAVFARGLRRTVTRLRSAGKTVLLMGTIPAHGTNVPECLSQNLMPFARDADCSVSSERAALRAQFADAYINDLSRHIPGACSYLPRKALCMGRDCLTQDGPDILYANDDHVTVSGASFIMKNAQFEYCAARETHDEN